MSLSLQPIREALADQIRNWIPQTTTVNPYVLPKQYPCITIQPPAGELVGYFGTFGPDGLGDVFFELTIECAGRTLDAQRNLDSYLSVDSNNPNSIVDAIHSDVTLGGVVESCVCLSSSADVPAEGDDTVKATLTVQIITRKARAQ
jgi:hypothetical protein